MSAPKLLKQKKKQLVYVPKLINNFSYLHFAELDIYVLRSLNSKATPYQMLVMSNEGFYKTKTSRDRTEDFDEVSKEDSLLFLQYLLKS